MIFEYYAFKLLKLWILFIIFLFFFIISQRPKASRQKPFVFQWEGLTAEQSAQIQASDQAATKLSRLNQSRIRFTRLKFDGKRFKLFVDKEQIFSIL